MKKILLRFLVFSFTAGFLSAQHLPHKIDNQWHYDCSIMPGGQNYAAIVTGRETINNIEYWKIDRLNALTGELIETVYDRTEGDSLYIRKVACPEELIINFNWPVGHIEVTALGNDCYSFKKLVSIHQRNIFGLNTQSYQFQIGDFCEGYTDTLWLLFMPEISRDLGCYWADDGRLVGAVINGVTYGTLYPLPVELINFSAVQENNYVKLKWQTATETNNAGYEILKKKYEVKDIWEKAAFIEGKGTSSEISDYVYIDKDIENGSWFYRIVQHDYDGTTKLIGETPVDVIIYPEDVTLEQNYPNPFNPETTIEYNLNSEQKIKLKIYDVMGSEIAVLVNEHQSAGNHYINFSGADLTSGVYIYTLEAGENFRVGQMVLLK